MDRQIGAQYYTLRNYIQTVEDFETTCKKVKEIGYKIIQISGTSLAAADMRPIIDKYGLEVVTTHKVFKDFVEHLDDVIDYNKTLGCKLCGLGVMPGSAMAEKDGLEKFIYQMNAVAKELQKEGLLFGYHNHAFEFIKMDGKTVMERLIEETDPDGVKFIVDTYWVQAGGKNPVDFIKGLGERAMAVHFKDMKANADNTHEYCEVGEGNLDWNAIIEACDEAGTKWALVELDVCKRDPFESLKMSYDFLKTKGFY